MKIKPRVPAPTATPAVATASETTATSATTVYVKTAAPAAVPPPAPVIASTALVKPIDGLPAYVRPAAEGVGAGLENTSGEGLQLPLLFLAQPLTPLVVQAKMKAGDVFLSSDPEVTLFGVGQEVNFVPFFHFREWIEWAPRESGEGILARSKDARGELAKLWQQQWADRRRKRRGEEVADRTSRVDEYHVFFLFFEGNYEEPVALPLCRTKHKKGRLLISLALRRGLQVPLYAGKYSISTVIEKNRAGQSYFNFDFGPNGWVSEAEYELAGKAYQAARESYDSLLLAYLEAHEAEPDGGAEVEGETF